MSASMWRLCTASLFCVAGSVTSARVPASLPVPEVVGTCISATLRPCDLLRPHDVVQWPARCRAARPPAWRDPSRCRRRSRRRGRAAPVSRQRQRRFEIGQIRLGLDLAEDGDLALAGQHDRRARALKASATTRGARSRSARGPAADRRRPCRTPNSRTRRALDLDRREGVGHWASVSLLRSCARCRRPARSA